MTPERWEQVLSTLEQAMALAEEAREDYLERIGATDPELRQEIASLLAADKEAGSAFLSTPAAALMAAPFPHSPMVGRHVGRYELIAEIGSGGMGDVYRARRADQEYQHEVAIKLVRSGRDLSFVGNRLRAERQILASLQHPNIARLLDGGTTQDGIPYIVMELIHGRPIDEYCNEHRLDIRARLKLLMEVCAAVQYAHQRMVIHRDLKPTNILVTADGVPKLLDFGIAKVLQPGAIATRPEPVTAAGDGCALRKNDSTQLTRFGERALTPGYASPEHIAGQSLGTASDVYSLGVVLYELLTGYPPYQLSRDSPGALEEAILHADAIRPSQRVDDDERATARASTLKKLVRTLRGELDNIALKALRKDPGVRYPTVAAFAHDIANYLEGAPVSAHPSSTWYRSSKWMRRYKLAVAASTTTVIAILLGAGMALHEAHVANAQRDRAVALSARSEGVIDFLDGVMTEAAQSNRPVTVTELLTRSEFVAKHVGGGSAENQAEVLRILAAWYGNMGRVDRAGELQQEALQRLAHSADSSLRAQLHCEHAEVANALGSLEAGIAEVESALQTGGLEADPLIGCLLDRAHIAESANDAGGALHFARLAALHLPELPPGPTMRAAMVFDDLAYAFFLNGHNDEANRYFALSMDMFSRLGRSNGPFATNVKNDWAIVLNAMGQPRRALQIYEELATADKATVLVRNHAFTLMTLGRFEAAETEYRICAERAHTEDNADPEARCLIGLGTVALERGDLEAATARFESARGIVEKSQLHRKAERELLILRGNLALRQNQLPDARAAFERATLLDPTLADAPRLGRAEVDLTQGDLSRAETDAREALTIAEKARTGVPHSYRSGLALLMLARILRAEHQSDAAQKAVGRAIVHLSNTVDVSNPALQRALALEQSHPAVMLTK